MPDIVLAVYGIRIRLQDAQETRKHAWQSVCTQHPGSTCWVVSHQGDVNSAVLSWLLGPDLDSHRGLHNRLWGHVCKDLEGPCHLQKCKDEEEGNESFRFIWLCLFDFSCVNRH